MPRPASVLYRSLLFCCALLVCALQANAARGDQLMNTAREPARTIYANPWPPQAVGVPQSVAPQGAVVPAGVAPVTTYRPGWRWPWQRKEVQPVAVAPVAVPPTVVQRPVVPAQGYYPVQPVTAYSPVVGAAPSACGCPQPCPAPNLCPQAAAVVQPTVVQYRPYVSFRSVPQTVPVTDYRPQTVVDPATGAPVTVMRPCERQVVTMQRVPFTAYHPGAVQQGAPVLVGGAVNPCCETAAPIAAPAPCNGCQSAAPYYTAPQAGAAAPPAQLYGAPTAQPTPAYQQPPYQQPQSGDPASIRPSLDPSGLPQMQQPQQQLERPLLPEEQHQFQIEPPPGAGSAYPPANDSPTRAAAQFPFPPADPTGSPAAGERSAGSLEPENAVKREPAVDPLRDLKPLPDPDFGPDWRDREAPQLLNPNDKTAARELIRDPDLQRVSHTVEAPSAAARPPVAGSAPAAAQPTTLPPAASIQSAPAWDDTGWKTAR